MKAGRCAQNRPSDVKVGGFHCNFFNLRAMLCHPLSNDHFVLLISGHPPTSQLRSGVCKEDQLGKLL